MPENLARKLIGSKLIEGEPEAGREVALAMDQALLQDATGTLAWLEFEQMGVDEVRIGQATQYVDHNTLQTGYESPDDHVFLQSMCARYGAVFSRAGNGISHWAHLEAFDVPGDSMLGCDSHTPQAGAMGMLAIGAGGLEVAAVMAGEPYRFAMPSVVEVRLEGELPAWSSAKDVILEILRRKSVRWGRNKILEFTGPGVAGLTVPERGTIANMVTELGATTGVFPSDDATLAWMRAQHRATAWKPMAADEGAAYDERVDVDLASVEPLIAKPHSPDNVVPVREVAGLEVKQVAVGSSVNSSFRDLAIVAEMLDGREVKPGVSMAVSPGSRRVLLLFMTSGGMTKLIRAGVRELEVACGPCIGMGFAPPSGGPSVRTFNRNFRGRSGTADDAVYLASPETAAATAARGVITDPRDFSREEGLAWRRIPEPTSYPKDWSGYVSPPPRGERRRVDVVRGPNIVQYDLPTPPGEDIDGEVLIKLGDNVSTDDILPAGAKILPLRSNIPAISDHVFEYVDPTFPRRAREAGGGIIVGGDNYGQGSSREHAAAAPAHLGVRAVLAKGFARIHRDNLVNFGVVPLVFADPADHDSVEAGHQLHVEALRGALEEGRGVTVHDLARNFRFEATFPLSSRERAILLAGGAVRWLRRERESLAAR
ncbi:MAG TPA: aconitate hydratase [Candidatus Thermoplasmatota archaeon]|nr:aconitate hydratase [Candidatus Thermoplasmatota archaeon]